MTTSLKGYLCQADDGIWYLCQTPNIKSCCVRKQQCLIPLEGDFSAYNTKRPVEIHDGIVTQKQGLPFATIGLTLLSLLLIMKLMQGRKRSHPLP